MKEQDQCELMFETEVNRPSRKTEHASQKKSVSSRVLHILEGLSEESSDQLKHLALAVAARAGMDAVEPC